MMRAHAIMATAKPQHRVLHTSSKMFDPGNNANHGASNFAGPAGSYAQWNRFVWSIPPSVLFAGLIACVGGGFVWVKVDLSTAVKELRSDMKGLSADNRDISKSIATMGEKLSVIDERLTTFMKKQ